MSSYRVYWFVIGVIVGTGIGALIVTLVSLAVRS